MDFTDANIERVEIDIKIPYFINSTFNARLSIATQSILNTYYPVKFTYSIPLIPLCRLSIKLDLNTGISIVKSGSINVKMFWVTGVQHATIYAT